MASTTFSGPVTSTNGFVGATTLPTYTVATAPDASSVTAGTIIYVSNGEAGSPCIAVSDESDWYAGTGAVIAIA
jgi:hypothetical protein